VAELSVLFRWEQLRRAVNDLPGLFGTAGVRDPEHPCADFNGRGYDGTGNCLSDGHYECARCSHLAPNAPRFEEHGRDGRRDRLRLFWTRLQGGRRG
jgi:hypothetical protein